MTTKEKIIRKTIAEVERKLAEIKALLDATPLTEICKIRMEAQRLLEENTSLEQRTSHDFIKKIEDLSRREKEQFEIADKAKDSIKLIDKKVNLEIELSDLNRELYYIK